MEDRVTKGAIVILAEERRYMGSDATDLEMALDVNVVAAEEDLEAVELTPEDLSIDSLEDGII